MTTKPTPASPLPRVRQTAIIGNVSVGKTALFDVLTKGNQHSVNIPGSTLEAVRGVMAIGQHGAPRSLQRQCAACQTGRKQRHQCGSDEVFEAGSCPGLHLLEERGTDLLIHLYDTPGSGTLAAGGEDEMVARDLLLSGEIDSVLMVADAKNLRRSLALVLEASELRLPMVLTLNMADEAEDMGIEIDIETLSSLLGVDVAQTVAVERHGVKQLSELLSRPKIPGYSVAFPDLLEHAIEEMAHRFRSLPHPRALAVLTMQGDKGAFDHVKRHLGEPALKDARRLTEEVRTKLHTPLRELIAQTYYDEAKKIVDRTLVATVVSPSPLVRFGSLVQRPLPGLLTAAFVLLLTYLFVGEFGATLVVDTLSVHLFDGVLLPLCERAVAHIPSQFIRDAIMDPDFGLLPTGLFLALGIVLPVLFCFYLLQAILEDSGYLPRLAVLLDRLFRWLGLNGQSLIPLILGFSCITMAVITTRMLPSKKERIILTLLVLLGIPCAPLLAVMMVILAEMPWTATAAIFGIITTQILIAGMLASRLIPGRLPDLILEIPKMRIPRPRIILNKTWRRTAHFMREAIPIFLAASFVIFLFDRLGGLTALENLLHPFIHGVLGLPDEFVQIFIKTTIRRENGATELLNVRSRFDNIQMVVTMLVMTFLMPCINATIVVFKERGIKTALIILGTVIIWAIIVGATFNFVCRSLGFTFT